MIGVQLWTVRDQLDDVDRVFGDLAAVGAEAVEPFGLGDPSLEPTERVALARAMKASADRAGLEILSTHADLPDPADTTSFLDEMGELGVKYAVSSMPESLHGFSLRDFTTHDGVRRYADTFNRLAAAVESAGLRVGYHNHSWEWNELDDGTFAYDALWRAFDRRPVAEVDVLWAEVAGQDAVGIVERLGERVRLLHVGDARPITDVDNQVSVGSGDAPVGAVLDRARDVEAVFIEVTTPARGSTPLDLVRDGVSWLRGNLSAA